MYRGLQVTDGLLNSDIQQEEGNSSIRQMIARLVGEYSRNGVNATTSVFCHQGFAYATTATPVLSLAGKSITLQYGEYLPGDEREFLLVSHGYLGWGNTGFSESKV